MDGVKGEEQMPGSNEVVVSIMNIEQASREDTQIPKSSSLFTPNIVEESSEPPLDESSQVMKSPTSDTSCRSSKGEHYDDHKNDEYLFGADEIFEKRSKRLKVRDLVEIIMFVCVLVVLVISLSVGELRHHKIWDLDTWRWCLMGFILLSGSLLCKWFVDFLVFLLARKFLLRKRTIYLIYGMRKSSQTLIWLVLVLVVWVFLIMRGVEQPGKRTRILKRITRGVISCLVGAILWMLKTFLLKKAALSFYTTNFDQRVVEAATNETLFNALMGQRLDKQTEDDIEYAMFDEDVPSIKDMTNVLDVQLAAYQIFRNVAKPDCEYIDEKDLRCFLKSKDVLALMKRLGTASETAKIKKSTLRNWLVSVYKDRQFLGYSLQDNKAIIKELNTITSIFLVVVTIVISLLIMEIATAELIILISSQIAVLAFIFGNACKNLFECVIFLFVRRVFSVGDCCVIDGVQMIVQEMLLSKTTFLKNEKERIVFPNSILITKPITNFYRIPPTNYSVEFVINLSTSDETIEELKAKVKAYIEKKDDHWHLEHSIQYKEIIEPNKLKMVLNVSHSVYFLDDEEKSSQRSSLVFQVNKILDELDSSNRYSTGNIRQGESDEDNDDDGNKGEEVSVFDELSKTEKRINKRKVWGIIEISVLVCMLVVLMTSLNAHNLRHHKIWDLETWRWCLMGFVILCGRLLSKWFVNFIVHYIEREYLLKKHILYFAYGLRKSFQALIWSAMALLVWVVLIIHGADGSAETRKFLKHITRGLVLCLVTATLWMAKTLLLKKLAVSHTDNFNGKLQQSIGDEYLLSTLLGPPMLVERNDGESSVDRNTLYIRVLKSFYKGTNRLAKGISGIATDQEYIARFGQIRDVVNAKKTANRIFKNVAKPACKYIEVEDLMRFVSWAEADMFMQRLRSVSETGKLKKSTLRNWLVNAYKDRQFLEYALSASKENTKELSTIMSGILFLVIIVISLLVMKVMTMELVILLCSQIAVLAFIFGNACKDLFECVIFVFAQPLYSVGDCCVIEGVQMTVQEMSISKTAFLRNEMERIVFPNSILITKAITNFGRTPPTNYSVEFVISSSTSVEKIEALKAKTKGYIERSDDHWCLEHTIQYKEIIEMNKVKMALNVSHSVYFLDEEEKSSQRSSLIFQLKTILQELDIS